MTAAQQRLVVDHLGLAVALADRALRPAADWSLHYDDVKQIAYLALARAAMHFDPGRTYLAGDGTRRPVLFSTFAYASIKRSLARDLGRAARRAGPPGRARRDLTEAIPDPRSLSPAD